ncbi:MAG: TrmH family RNA methyltransferase [Bacteroidota bacterium]|nr:TrmH family RNA methyltransferase [Bacteroidota bacterium]
MKQTQSEFNAVRKNINERIKLIHENRVGLSLILDRMGNPANAGMILRIADAARIREVIFFQPAFDIYSEKLKKYSRSTTKYVKFSEINSAAKIKEKVNNAGFVALEKTNKSINYQEFIPGKEIFLAVGSEKFGLSEDLLTLTQSSLHLPTMGVNTSINVATAVSPVVFYLVNKMQTIL